MTSLEAPIKSVAYIVRRYSFPGPNSWRLADTGDAEAPQVVCHDCNRLRIYHPQEAGLNISENLYVSARLSVRQR